MKSMVCNSECSLSLYICIVQWIIECGICHSTGRVCYRCLNAVDSLIEVSIRIELIKSMFQFHFACPTECSVSVCLWYCYRMGLRAFEAMQGWGCQVGAYPLVDMAKKFTPSILPNFNEWKWRNSHRGSDGMDKSHLYPLVSCLAWGYAGRGARTNRVTFKVSPNSLLIDLMQHQHQYQHHQHHD